MKNVLIVKIGQSNFQGAARGINGVTRELQLSRYSGQTDPYPMCNNLNKGGGIDSFLIDRLFKKGIKAKMIDCTIGGASIFLYTGRQGWVLTGTPTDPANLGYSSTVSYTGTSTNAVLVEGDSGFDPCGLLARTRARIAIEKANGGYDSIWVFWSNGESDVSYGQASFHQYYTAALNSIIAYVKASGADKCMIGMTIKYSGATVSNMDYLSLAVDNAIAQNTNTYKGADLYVRFGSDAPLIPESPPNGATRVHMDLRGQEIHAKLWVDAIEKAGLLV